MLLNSEFICIIVTVQSNLENWGKRVNFGNGVDEIQQKYEIEREKVWERKFWIFGNGIIEIYVDQETNCSNAIAEIGNKKICGNVIAENERKKK